MEHNDKVKNNSIKNRKCYYFDDINKFEDFYFDDFWIEEKSCKNISVYKISYKTLISAKPMWIRFNKVNGSVKVHDRI